ncbi:MAG TPA: hypothetical protein VKM72_09345 [Thermoanaerobaculia bacterium]|nr:hypothetical protein [Thermoanaerobaculia bacterium]
MMSHSFHLASSVHPLVLETELAALRDGPARNTWYYRLHTRCLEYVLDYRNYRRILSVEDGEEIVSQALFEELHCIGNSEVGAAEASWRVQRALNRGRARYCRAIQRWSRTTPSLIADIVDDADTLSALVYEEFAREVREYLGQALGMLRDRDRNLLIDHYHLEGAGLVRRGETPVFASPGALKVSLFRARQRFFCMLEHLLAAAAAKGRDGEAERTLRTLLSRRAGKAHKATAAASARVSGCGGENLIGSVA